MSDLLPDQVRVLAKVVNSQEILLSMTLQIEREDASRWLRTCEALVVLHAEALRGKHFAFRLDRDAEGGCSVELAHILAATGGSGSTVLLDLQGRWISAESGAVTVSAALLRTKQTGRLEVLVHGTYVYVILAGEVLTEHDVMDASKLPPAGIAFYRPTRQLRELIFDHAGNEIARETGVKYWADRKKRILLAIPESTEKIFQRSLLSWLRHYASDRIRIVSETRGFGQDATDITVMTSRGDYVIEVKWMGKNEKGTSYDLSRVAEGVEQIRIYLDNDQRLISGAVVLYDARAKKAEAEDQIDASVVHPRCQMPHIVWLESDTPSQLATTIVRDRKVKSTPTPAGARRKTGGRG
jgi:hypothetical protein